MIHLFRGKKKAAFPELHDRIPPSKYDFLYANPYYLGKIVRGGGHFSIENGRLMLQWGKCKMFLQTEEEVFIFCEVFLDQDYLFVAKGEWEVIDIGTNIGASALFFSQLPYVKAVHTFEPFAPTYELAELNFALNPLLNDKIKLNKVGLGLTNQTLAVDYDPEWKASMSLNGSLKKGTQGATQRVDIEVKNTSECLQPILNNTSAKFFMKVDCEGSEYAIFEDLIRSGLIHKVSGIALETHYNRHSEIEENLIEQGFLMKSTKDMNQETGFLFGFRG